MEDAARSPGRSGSRSSTNAGGRCATSSTTPTCTASTGRRCTKKYEPLVAHVNHRADLTYVIGEMIARAERRPRLCRRRRHAAAARGFRLGLLGAEAASATQDGLLPRSSRSCKGANWDEKLRSPLDRDRRRREGRRLHHRHRRQADQRDDATSTRRWSTRPASR